MMFDWQGKFIKSYIVPHLRLSMPTRRTVGFATELIPPDGHEMLKNNKKISQHALPILHSPWEVKWFACKICAVHFFLDILLFYVGRYEFWRLCSGLTPRTQHRKTQLRGRRSWFVRKCPIVRIPVSRYPAGKPAQPFIYTTSKEWAYYYHARMACVVAHGTEYLTPALVVTSEIDHRLTEQHKLRLVIDLDLFLP